MYNSNQIAAIYRNKLHIFFQIDDDDNNLYISIDR